jgi:hypothetical protein
MSSQAEEGAKPQLITSNSNHDNGGTFSKTGHHLELSPPAVNIRQATTNNDSKVQSPQNIIHGGVALVG